MEMIYSIDFAILDFIQQFIKCAFLDIPMLMLSYMGEAGGVWILMRSEEHTSELQSR